MTQFDNTNRGSIWKNEKKREGKQDADFTGSINIEGVEYWLNGWRRKEGAAAKAPAMTFTVRRKGALPAAAIDDEGEVRPRKSAKEEMSDDIPF